MFNVLLLLLFFLSFKQCNIKGKNHYEEVAEREEERNGLNMSVLHEPGERGGRREGSVDECDLAWSETGA